MLQRAIKITTTAAILACGPKNNMSKEVEKKKYLSSI